jgi:ABC-type transport system involved in cytochrome bd biosynthesis fused ATPase/permease subunit
VDLTEGAADPAANGARGRAARRARRAASRIARPGRRRARTTSLACAVLVLFQGAALAAVTWSALRAHADGPLSPAHLTVLAVLTLVSFEALQPLPAAACRLAEVRVRAERPAGLFVAPAPVTEPGAPGTGGPLGVHTET